MKHVVIRDAGSNQIIADAPVENVITIEGTYYLPAEKVNLANLEITQRTDSCQYKGISNQIDFVEDGVRVENIAWVYQNTKPDYDYIRDMIGFYKRSLRGTIVQVVEDN